MPLHILLILVVGGIAGIALALHLLGMTGADPLREDTARAAWLRAYPDDSAQRVAVSADGRVARIDSAAGRGLVWRMGADTCARLLTDGAVAHARGSRVRVHLGDYAAPRVAITLTEDEQAEWADWMASI